MQAENEAATSSFRWLCTGDEGLGEMLAAIEAAQRSVRLEIYIFAASPVGERFRDALTRAAARGARVRVLIDAFGSFQLTDSFWAPLRAAGGELRWFNPLTLRRLTFRDHRKVLVCDDAVAFVGGFNIAPEYEGDCVTRGWRDLGLRVTGPLVASLAAAFDEMFARHDLEHPPLTRLRPAQSRRSISGSQGHLLLSGPGRGHNAFKAMLLHDLRRARRVQIVMAYFLPTGRVRRALHRVARRGAQLELVLPGKSDVPLARIAGQALYRRLLRAGARIFEYEPQVLHSKLLIIDDAVYVGSANLDPRSLHINYELMLRLTDPAVVAQAREIFEEHRRHSREITREAWSRSRSWFARLKERWAWFILGRLDHLFMRRQLRLLQREPTR